MDGQNNKSIPFAILAAGLMVAGAVYFGGAKGPSKPNTASLGNQPPKIVDVRKLDKNDHVLGNPDAKVTIIEYSDLECRFCQSFHTTMQKVMSTYGKDGKVAFVYRHFPLSQIHKNAQKASEGSECAAELGGNTKFWEFIDNVFADQQTQSKKVANLGAVAKDIGLDVTKFQTCLDSGKYTNKVLDEAKEGATFGVTGTPKSFILVDGKMVDEFGGAVPFESVKVTLDGILK